MKKSKIVQLVLVSATLASCQQKKTNEWGQYGDKPERKAYMRSDSTAPYQRSHFRSSGFYMYRAFRPYGSVGSSGGYQRRGYYSSSLSERANVGHNSSKSSAVRSGFGSSARSASS